MTTREQDHEIERLSLENGGAPVAIREGLLDGALHATLPNGVSFVIDRWGGRSREGTGLNFSVDWSER